MLCSHFSFVFLVSPAEQELLPVQALSRSGSSPSGTQQPGPVGPGPPHSCRTTGGQPCPAPPGRALSLPEAHGSAHIASSSWQGLPAPLSRNITALRPALARRCSCHLDPVSRCLVEQERFLFQGEIQTPQKEVLPPLAGFSAPSLAEQGSRPFPSLPAAADTRLGGFQPPLRTCSASVCLSEVESQPHLAINKYVSRLTASPIIIITPKLEGWHSR